MNNRFHVVTIDDGLSECNLAHDRLDATVVSAQASTSELAKHTHIDAFLLNIRDEKLADDWLVFLRQHSDWDICPILLLGGTHPLADNILARPTQADELLAQLSLSADRMRRLKLNDSSFLVNRLVRFLWVLPSRRLVAEKNITLDKAYHYPLLDIWDEQNPALKQHWLSKQAEAGLLSVSTLVNRTRTCCQCDSALLNYIDCCPSCHSIDVVTEKAIHCFTCGHVAEESTFLRNNKLACTNCHAQLKHIGTDYDRPIENVRCRSCKKLSVESDVMAHCFSCEEKNRTEDLIVNEFYEYELALNGLELAQTGHVQEALPAAITDSVSKPHLIWLLNWLQKTSNNSDSVQHCLVKVHIDNYNELQGMHSDLVANNMLLELQRRIEEFLEDKHTRCRIDDDLMLYVFPFTNDAELVRFQKHIEKIAAGDEDSAISLVVDSYHLSDDLEEEKMASYINQIIESDSE